ncbi:MAG: ABC transporter ATP-binding protein [Spirochaetes bacterium]|nr:ABC transporter ATP-binding protein [Spirochaetota bacterium]
MIKINDLSVSLGLFRLYNINLTIEEGSFFVLMGPTGAGKTVLLEAIAGLVPVRSGSIFIGNRDVTKLPPEKHGVSIMYQDHSLFPHLDVIENIRYGLRYHRLDKCESDRRVSELVDQLGLSHLLNRLPLNLSGGELQRVSLARALAVNPRILMLDEPLSALDPNFRYELRQMLKSIHKTTKVTLLMVTHDFGEAISLAERAAIMDRGRIVQTGTVDEVFQKPCCNFAADFVGMRNIFPVQFKGTKAVTGGLVVELGRKIDQDAGHIAIRPEDIVISNGRIRSSMRNSFQGRVLSVIDLGFFYEIEIMAGEVLFRSLIAKGALFELNIREKAEVVISFKAAAIHNF